MIDINAMTTGLKLPVKHIKIKGRPDVPYVSWQDTRKAMDERAAEHGVTISYEVLNWEMNGTSAIVHARITMSSNSMPPVSESESVYREAIAQEIIGRGQAPPLEVAESSAFKRAAMRFGFSAGVDGEWASESRPQSPPPAAPAWRAVGDGNQIYGVDASLRVGVKREEDGHFSVAGFRGRERFDIIDAEDNKFVALQDAKTFAERRWREEKDGGGLICSVCNRNAVYAAGGVCGECQIAEV